MQGGACSIKNKEQKTKKMKKLLLSLLLLLPFAAAKADIFTTYTFSFTGGDYHYVMDGFNIYPVVDNTNLTGNGTYTFNTTTNTATNLSLTIAGVTMAGTYGLADLSYDTGSHFGLTNGIGVYLTGGQPYIYSIGFFSGWQSTSFAVSSTTTGGSAVAPVPEPSS